MNWNQTILPRPKSISQRDGHLNARSFTPTSPDIHDELVTLFPNLFAANTPTMSLSAHVDANVPREGYQIDTTPDNVTISHADRSGLFHALQTLRQIVERAPNPIPCFSIEDHPDLPLRGLSLDVSRGKVPTLETLLGLVDRLAQLKMNHLQLYVEHTFAFAFDPDISANCSPLTPDDLSTLDAHCRARCINLVPSLATFGHMGRILSIPRYQHLADIPAEGPWDDQSWLQRQRGLTLDPTNPESRKLLDTMLAEFLPLFSAPFANVNADETHDLGMGRSKSRANHVGKGRLYVDHLKFLADRCEAHGKQMMFWGDIIRNHAALLHELPEDAVLLDWGYEPDSEFPALTSPHRHERDVIPCPGTSGWKRIINDYDAAETNMANAANAAQTHHAAGMIVTDWGDDGHFNLLSCSLPMFAVAANHAWNTDARTRDESLDDAINRWLLGDRANNQFASLRHIAGALSGSFSWQLLRDTRGNGLTDSQRHALSILVNDHAPISLDADVDTLVADEWNLTIEAARLLAAKNRHASAGWNGRVDEFCEQYADIWRRANKPHRLNDILVALRESRHNDS